MYAKEFSITLTTILTVCTMKEPLVFCPTPISAIQTAIIVKVETLKLLIFDESYYDIKTINLATCVLYSELFLDKKFSP